LRVGLFVVGAIGVLIFLILNASGDISLFKSKLHVRAQFANADGVHPGSEVRLAGVRVGKVDDVKLLQPSADRQRRRSKSNSPLIAKSTAFPFRIEFAAIRWRNSLRPDCSATKS
jgi:ABC-type transporter Mla subunit MlaD